MTIDCVSPAKHMAKMILVVILAMIASYTIQWGATNMHEQSHVQIYKSYGVSSTNNISWGDSGFKGETIGNPEQYTKLPDEIKLQLINNQNAVEANYAIEFYLFFIVFGVWIIALNFLLM